MKRPAKKRLMQALNSLIYAYSNDTISHSIVSCPLCQIYVGENRGRKANESLYKCNNCINTIFVRNPEDSNSEYGCVSRGIKFKKLDFDMPTVKENRANHPHLAKFWKEVKDYLITEKLDDILNITPEIKANILKIAENYK
jgi:hypothetical protein